LEEGFVGGPGGFDLPERGAAVGGEDVEGADGREGAAVGGGEFGADEPVVDVGEGGFGASREHGLHGFFGEAFDVAEAEADGWDFGFWILNFGLRGGNPVLKFRGLRGRGGRGRIYVGRKARPTWW